MKKVLFALCLVVFYSCTTDNTDNEKLDIVFAYNNDKYEFDVDERGDEIEISFTTNCPWRIETYDEWVRASSTQGDAGEHLIKIIIDKNISGKWRTAGISIIYGHPGQKEQERYAYFHQPTMKFWVDDRSHSVSAQKGELSIEVFSMEEFYIQISDDDNKQVSWITSSEILQTDAESYKINFKIDENFSDESRVAYAYFKTTNNHDNLGNVKIYQYGGNIPTLPDCEKNEIYYTTTDGCVITPSYIEDFGGGKCISNVVEGGLGKITFENEITSIPDKAFSERLSLSSIRFPGSVKIIGYSAFERSGLRNIAIPNGVEGIGGAAFHECRKLKEVTISSSVEYISSKAFCLCPIDNVYCHPSYPPRITSVIFSTPLKIYVPMYAVEDYRNDSYWSIYSYYIEGSYFQ